jgi:hypothetical protein
MRRGWLAQPGPRLLLLSGKDYTAREFEEYARLDAGWTALLRDPQLQRIDIDGADHTFSDPDHWQAVLTATQTWLRHALNPRGARHA